MQDIDTKYASKVDKVLKSLIVVTSLGAVLFYFYCTYQTKYAKIEVDALAVVTEDIGSLVRSPWDQKKYIDKYIKEGSPLSTYNEPFGYSYSYYKYEDDKIIVLTSERDRASWSFARYIREGQQTYIYLKMDEPILVYHSMLPDNFIDPTPRRLERNRENLICHEGQWIEYLDVIAEKRKKDVRSKAKADAKRLKAEWRASQKLSKKLSRDMSEEDKKKQKAIEEKERKEKMTEEQKESERLEKDTTLIDDSLLFLAEKNNDAKIDN
jgi:hypothetical protein